MSQTEPDLLQNSEIPVIVDQKQYTIALQKYYSGRHENTKNLEWTSDRIQNVIKSLDEYNLAKSQRRRATNQQYYHATKYDVMTIDNQKVLIMKRKKNISDPAIQIIPTEEYYQKILDAHIATGHGRRDKIVHTLRDKYLIPIFAITIFINMCKVCISKKNGQKSEIVVSPLVSSDLKGRGQVNFVDFQAAPDGDYKWLLQYQDDSTKFSFLRPLKSKQAKEVAIELLKIFLEVGCPSILQSDNGREFTASVLKEIVSLWPDCKIVHGTPQSQDNIGNEDVKNMIWAWMANNKSLAWSMGCYFVQFQMNSSYHSTVGMTPYKAFFGVDPKRGLSSTFLSKEIISKLETEEDLERVFKETDNNEKQDSPAVKKMKNSPIKVVDSNL